MKTEPQFSYRLAAWLFYLLIVFEIVYMVMPFLAYFYYSAYGPSLNFLSGVPLLSWMPKFFLPHFSETSVQLLNLPHTLSRKIFLMGLLIFAIGALQIYFAKFFKKGTVVRGLYRFVRHPQYLAFSVMGFGLLLLWPRFVVLFMFTTMLFVYYFLARKEERECAKKYGDSYRKYVQKTSMFLPGDRMIFNRLPNLPWSGYKKALAILSLYFVVITGIILMAFGIRDFSLSNLSSHISGDAVTIAIVPMEEADVKTILDISSGLPEVADVLKERGYGAGEKLINYIVPREWIVPDLPLDPPHVSRKGHYEPKPYNEDEFKVLFTVAHLPEKGEHRGVDIVRHAQGLIPVVVVHLNKADGRILHISEPPDHALWGDIPMPLF